jgi:precorrin-2 dehydrogenase/sirohydrochlorin ferrochelatase
VWVASASDPAAGDFITPATVRSGALVIAVSTGGAAPALARRIRERLQHEYDESFAAWLSLLGELRPAIRATADEERRRRLWDELTRWEWLDRLRSEGIDAVRVAMRKVFKEGK